MKRKLFISSLIFIVGFVFGQVANERAWRDLEKIKRIETIKSTIQQLNNEIARFEMDKTAIWSDVERKNFFKQLILLYPYYTMDSIDNYNDKFDALKDFLEENDYLEEE